VQNCQIILEFKVTSASADINLIQIKQRLFYTSPPYFFDFAITFDLIKIEASNLDENARLLDKFNNVKVRLKTYFVDSLERKIVIC